MDDRSAPADPGPAAATQAARPAVLEAALRRAYTAGRSAHAGLPLPYEAFARRAERRSGSPTDAAAALERAAQADLFLAICCEAGLPGAWEEFSGTYRGRLEGLLLARGVDRADAEALAADLLADLALPPPRAGLRTLLGTYDGSGSLFAWLSVILARRRANAAARRPTTLSEEHAAARGPAEAPGPLETLLQGEAARAFRDAFARAWAGLSDRERLLLLWKHREGAKQAEIAALLGIGAPRVSRVLDRAIEKIRHALRAQATGTGRPVWSALRDAVARQLARSEVTIWAGHSAPPATPRGRKDTP